MLESLGWSPSLAELQMWQQQFNAVYAAHPVIVSLVYVLVFTVVSALCLPGAAVLMLISGAAMGLWVGTLLANLASVLGACLALLAVRRGWRRQVEQRWRAQLQQLNEGLVHSGARYILWLRLLPVIPYAPLNLLCGLTRLRLLPFAWASFAGMLPGTAVYVNAGTELAALQSLEDLWSPSMLWALALLIALATLPFVLNQGLRRLKR